MAWQSSLEQVRSVRLGRNTVVGLAAGILVGLLLGLLIGWVWWPVEWQGAESAAAPATLGSQFEAPEAKALYLGAVADAFVYGSAAGDPDAASTAAQRLAALGGDMRAAFNNAIDFYNAQAGSAARVSNLTALAAALGIPLETAGAAPVDAAGLPAGDGAAEPAAVVQATPAATPAATGGGGSTNWLLALLTALILIGGGLYLLWVLSRRNGQGNSAPFDEEEPAPAAATTVTAFERSTLTPMRSSLTPAASIRSTVERPQPSQGGGPHGFDADEPDELDELDEPSYDDLADEQDMRVRYQRAADLQEDNAYNPASDDEDADDWPEEDVEVEQPDRHAGPPPGYVTAVGATPPYSGARSNNAAEERQPQAVDPAAAAPAPRTPPPATLQPPTPSRFAQYTPIGNYTATYYVGRPDFDHAENIQHPADGSYIGEYGIIIPPGQGVLNNDPDKAIAMDVYLFDKSDERQPLTVKRWLLSTYAADDRNKLAEFERDKQCSKPPIVAQPNTNFQLEGVQLLLDCSIKQVTYTLEGYFQNVTVDLVLKRKS